jgi:hypothetical protein
LHIFSDPSTSAYGAIAYLRSTHGNNIEIAFLLSKARIAPLKLLTVPRLEMQAAVLAVRLANTIKSEMRINIGTTTFWIDSEIVLRWINSVHCRYSDFVSHRISELLDKTSPRQWRFVPGEQNPADLCTGGILPKAFDHRHQWISGPPFLLQTEEKWPTNIQLKDEGFEDVEFSKNKGFISNINIVNVADSSLTCLIKKHATLTELERAVAENQVKESDEPNRVIGVEELEGALNSGIRSAQEECFEKEIKDIQSRGHVNRLSSLLTLNPFLDSKGLLRVGGRLNHANLPECTRHPVILKQDHALTLLIVKHCHDITNHAGVERTLAEVRSQKQRARPTPPLMAALPKERLEAFSLPFTNVGVDFFGPMYVVVGRRREKRYGCIFTCFVTRAVHLEIAHRLDTDSFIMAFRRFIAIKGTPAVIFMRQRHELSSW